MQNARSQRPRRSATATPGHPASRALRSSLAQASSSLGSEGPHVAAQGARPRRGAVRVRHWEAIFHRSGISVYNSLGFEWVNPVLSLFEDWVLGWVLQTGLLFFSLFQTGVCMGVEGRLLPAPRSLSNGI